MRDQLNAGATFEKTQTWKTIHTIHSLIHSKKADMKAWLWWRNYIRGSAGPKASWQLSYRWGKPPKKPHPGNLSRPGNEPGPAAWHAHATACSTAVDSYLINKGPSNLLSRVFVISWLSRNLMDDVHRCGAGGSMHACHAAGPGSVLVGTCFLDEVLSVFFSHL